jgi:hypothetical protein
MATGIRGQQYPWSARCASGYRLVECRNFVERARKLERHLVILAHGCAGVFAKVECLVRRDTKRNGAGNITREVESDNICFMDCTFLVSGLVWFVILLMEFADGYAAAEGANSFARTTQC